MRVINRRKRRSVSVPCSSGTSVLHSETNRGRIRRTVPTVCFVDVLPGHHVDIADKYRSHPRIIDLEKLNRIHIPEVKE